MKVVANERRLEELKPGAWNPEKRKRTTPASQIGYKALTVSLKH